MVRAKMIRTGPVTSDPRARSSVYPLSFSSFRSERCNARGVASRASVGAAFHKLAVVKQFTDRLSSGRARSPALTPTSRAESDRGSGSLGSTGAPTGVTQNTHKRVRLRTTPSDEEAEAEEPLAAVQVQQLGAERSARGMRPPAASRAASSVHPSVSPSVRPSVCLSVRLSVRSSFTRQLPLRTDCRRDFERSREGSREMRCVKIAGSKRQDVRQQTGLKNSRTARS